MIRSLILALGAGLVIPVIGFLVTFLIFADFNSKLPKGVDVREICLDPAIVAAADLQGACTDFQVINLIYHASIWSGAAIALLLMLYVLAAAICGTNRNLLSMIFRPLVPISLVVLAGSVLVQGIILVASLYFAESYFVGRVHFIFIGALGIGALAGAISILTGLLKFKTKALVRIHGFELTRDENPKIWKKVDELTEIVGAQPPENIVVGLSPSFFVTNADVELFNKDVRLSGETLYLSLPIMRLLTEDQLSSVVAHELGHFKGDDLTYSMKFAPVYRGLEDALGSLKKNTEGAPAIAILPAAMLLSAMHMVFSRNEAKISRIRELEADKIAVEATSSEALALGLAKFSVYAGLWGHVRNKNADRISIGRISSNLCSVFEDSTRYDIEHSILSEVVENVASSTIAHPTDTHPKIGARYEAIGFSKESITLTLLTEVGHSSEHLIENLENIEQELSMFEHRLLIALGLAEKPDEVHGGPNGIENAIYSLAAGMIGADGKIEAAEVKSAEAIGASLLKGFDSIDFRIYCANLDQMVDFRDTVDALESVLETPTKLSIYEYLMRIASSDGEVAFEETELLKYVREKWELHL